MNRTKWVLYRKRKLKHIDKTETTKKGSQKRLCCHQYLCSTSSVICAIHRCLWFILFLICVCAIYRCLWFILFLIFFNPPLSMIHFIFYLRNPKMSMIIFIFDLCNPPMPIINFIFDLCNPPMYIINFKFDLFNLLMSKILFIFYLFNPPMSVTHLICEIQWCICRRKYQKSGITGNA